MNNFTQFKKEVGYSSERIESITGYTRQGLHYAFGMMDKNIVPSKKFLTCINLVIDTKIREEEEAMKREIEKRTKTIERMKKVKSNIENFKSGVR